MTTKRKRERESEPDVRMKRQRRRKRSSSEPGLLYDPVSAEKLQVLKRLFGRNCNTAFDGEAASSASETFTSRTFAGPEPFGQNDSSARASEEAECASNDEYQHNDYFNPGDENSDPLLDSVPVDLDPEQLGFLVCAQETLRFLNRRGFAFEHPVFTRLRSRLLRGMDELAVA